jgi:hypothetical protein
MADVTPTRAGQDLDSADGQYDAHVRLEEGEQAHGIRGTVVCADVFRTTIKDANAAHVESECEPWGNAGALHITEFLRGYGFDVRVRFG